MSVRCCARGRMERREAFQKWRLWRRGKDRVRDECSTLVIIDKTMKRGNILKHSANVWNYTLEFNCGHSAPHCSVKQCTILYVIKQSVGEKESILQIKICQAISEVDSPPMNRGGESTDLEITIHSFQYKMLLRQWTIATKKIVSKQAVITIL